MKYSDLDRDEFFDGYIAAMDGTKDWLQVDRSASGFGYSFGARVAKKIKGEWTPGEHPHCSANEVITALTAVVSGGEILLDSPAEVAAEIHALNAEFPEFASLTPSASAVAEIVAADRAEKYEFDRDASRDILART